MFPLIVTGVSYFFQGTLNIKHNLNICLCTFGTPHVTCRNALGKLHGLSPKWFRLAMPVNPKGVVLRCCGATSNLEQTDGLIGTANGSFVT